MSDEFAVQQTINAYSYHGSRGDLAAALDTFAPDAVWDIPALGVCFSGHAQIAEGLKSVLAPFEFAVQLNAPALIEVDGDRATARCAIRECGKYAGKDVALEALGFYTDELVRTPRGWKFARRTFEARSMHDYAIAPPSLLG